MLNKFKKNLIYPSVSYKMKKSTIWQLFNFEINNNFIIKVNNMKETEKSTKW